MKKVLLQLILAMLSVAAFAQSVDIKVWDPVFPSMALYPKLATEALHPKACINTGTTTTIEAEASFKIIDLSDNATIYSESQTIVILNGNLNVFFESITLTDFAIGDYQIRYEASTAFSDPNPNNNFIHHNFRITENEFAFGFETNYFLQPHSSNYDAGEGHSWMYGGMHVFKGLPIGSTLGKIRFKVGNPQEWIWAGETINCLIYEWDEDLNFNDKIDPNERVLVAIAQYTFNGTETPGEELVLDIFEFSTGTTWEISQNKVILFALESVSTADISMQFGVDTSFVKDSGQYFNGPIVGLPYPYSGIMVATNSELSVIPYTPNGGFIPNMNDINHLPPLAASFTIETPSSAKSSGTQKHQIKLLENPIQDLLQLEINSQALQPKYINIYNTMGQSLYTKKLDKMSDSMEISVGDFPDGTYHVIITGDNGSAVSTFVKTN